MENSELCIKVKVGSENTLVGFPYLEGQFLDYIEYDQNADDDTEWLVIDLADRSDITATQQQFIDTNPNVIEYTIR